MAGYYKTYEINGNFFFTPTSFYFYEIKIERPTDLNYIDLTGFKRDVFEISLIRSATLLNPIDIKIKNTFIRFVVSWFKNNNKILFFLVSNANGKAEKRKLVFEKWYRCLSDKEKALYDLGFQTIKEKNGSNSYLGFILRKDYPKFVTFKNKEVNIVSDIERNK